MKIEQDNFFDEKNIGEQKSKKTTLIIIILIAITLLAVIGIIFLLMTQKNDKMLLSIDGKAVNYSDDTFVFTEDGKVYISIADIAKLVGYEAHKGEYKAFTQDEDKLYVECKNETASFYLNSNTISKIAPEKTSEYENITISEPVVAIQNKLYVVSDGFSVAFNFI